MWGLSYQNLCMLMATIPKVDPEDKAKEKEKPKEVNSTQELAQFLNLQTE